MMKKLLLFCYFLVFAFGINAQNRQISGQVKDATTGEVLPGVNIAIKGTKTGVSTNSEGKFSIKVSDNATLVMSFVGYVSQSVNVGDRSIVDVVLEPTTTMLDEVVYIGYAPINRRDLTGSVSSLGARQLKDIPLTNAAEALTGKLAGVRVTTSEGSPGADIQIRIRGGGSITQDNSPIYVVDGIQIENALSFISPQDIESIDVLKDASTTAIYGARGANGVVIIITKSGKNAKTTVSYNGSTGYRQIFKTLDVMNPYDFVRWQYERSKGDATLEKSFLDQYGTFENINQYKTSTPINWQNEVFGRKAQYQNHNLMINGGDAKTSFNLSLTANKEDGILLESGFDRYLASFRIDHKASDKLKVGFNVRYLNQTITGAGTSGSGTKSTNRLRHSVQYRPLLIGVNPVIDDFDNDLYITAGNLINPILITEAEYRSADTKAVNLSGYFSYNILKNLVLKSTFGLDNNDAQTNQFYSKITGTARNFASLPVASIFTQNSVTFNNSNTLQYSQKFGKKHDFSVLLGQEIYDYTLKSTTIETRYFPADIEAPQALANMGLGSPPTGSAQARPISNESQPIVYFRYLEGLPTIMTINI